MTLSLFSLHVLCLSLLPGLDSPHFRHRERAHRSLAALGRLALPALEHGARSGRPEVARRCECLLAPYAVEIADRESYAVRPTRWQYLPWLDCGPHPSKRFVAEAVELGFSNAPPLWEATREATRLWVRSQLLQRVPRWRIVEHLDGMCWQEKWWIQSFGRSHGLPIPCDP